MDWSKLLLEKRYNSQNNIHVRGTTSEYEVDYLKIVTNQAFRRLQDKTQVFPLDKNDFVRTRLTHSLEVSYFAKLIIQKFSTLNSRKTITVEMIGQMSAIVSAAGLLHDIGNPPFGHYGETSIKDWFKENLTKLTFEGQKVSDLLSEQQCLDLLNFDGNAHSLRVVHSFHYVENELGMNLTYPLLNTLIKYPIPSTEIKEHPTYKKIGYYQSEESMYQDISQTLGTTGVRHPLTYVLEAADDLAYATADVEDAIKKGIICGQDVTEYLQNYIAQQELAERQVPHVMDVLTKADSHFLNSTDEQSNIRLWMNDLQSRLIQNAAYGFSRHHLKILAGEYRHDLYHGTDLEPVLRGLKQLTLDKIVNNREITKLELSGNTIITWLLDRFVPAAIYFDGTNKNQTHRKYNLILSESCKRAYTKKLDSNSELSESDKLYYRLLMVIDFISSMTDTYAKGLYNELNGN